MNLDLIFLLAFYGILLLLFLRFREKFDVQSKVFVLYRTKLGLKLMDRIAKAFPRLLGAVSYVSIAVGVLGVAGVFFFLVRETMKFVAVPGTQPPLAPVLPGVSIPGAPALSFWHWIITIFFVAVVHEFSHGIFARLHGIKVKHSGIAFLGPILLAFVEPDEKQLEKARLKKQLSVLSAGPFSNIIFGVLSFALLVFVMFPVQQAMFEPSGIIVGEVIQGYPLEAKGLEAPFLLTAINGMPTKDAVQFMAAAANIKPGDEVLLETDKGYYTARAVQSPDNSTKGMVGMGSFSQKLETKGVFKGRNWLTSVFMWVSLLISWLFIINIGVGAFNLLPIGPADGGRMLYFSAVRLIHERKKALQVFLFVNYVCLILLVINLLPWVWKFLVFIAKGLMFVVSLA